MYSQAIPYYTGRLGADWVRDELAGAVPLRCPSAFARPGAASVPQTATIRRAVAATCLRPCRRVGGGS